MVRYRGTIFFIILLLIAGVVTLNIHYIHKIYTWIIYIAYMHTLGTSPKHRLESAIRGTNPWPMYARQNKKILAETDEFSDDFGLRGIVLFRKMFWSDSAASTEARAHSNMRINGSIDQLVRSNNRTTDKERAGFSYLSVDPTPSSNIHAAF